MITYKELQILVDLFEEDYPEGVSEEELQEMFIYFFDDIMDNLKK